MTFLSPLNINVGVLGHVDSGKTSVSMALSTVRSTACGDKSPQSMARGITLDLGFSSLTLDLRSKNSKISLSNGARHRYVSCGFDDVRLTLVDCPGHATLIRTVLGGGSIVDVVLLVIDVTKGIQMQTRECLALAEALGRRLVVVLNKTDLLPLGDAHVLEQVAQKIKKGAPKEEQEAIYKQEMAAENLRLITAAKRRMRKELQHTVWADSLIVPFAATLSGNIASTSDSSQQFGLGGGKAVGGDAERVSEDDAHRLPRGAVDVHAIINALLETCDPVALLEERGCVEQLQHLSATASASLFRDLFIKTPRSEKLAAGCATRSFFAQYDHCFPIKGQGTVLTATVGGGTLVLSGQKDDRSSGVVLIPELGLRLKLRGLQVFHRAVDYVYAGDRVGICVAGGLNSESLERGLLVGSDAQTMKGGVEEFNPPYSTQGDDPSVLSRSPDALALTCGSQNLPLNDVLECPPARLLRQLLTNLISAVTILQTPIPLAADKSRLRTLALSHLEAANSILADRASPSTITSGLNALSTAVARSDCFIALVRKLRFHRLPVSSLSSSSTPSGGKHGTAVKYHITVGSHTTVMGTMRFFSCLNPYFTEDQMEASSATAPQDREALAEQIFSEEMSLLQLHTALPCALAEGETEPCKIAKADDKHVTFPFGYEAIDELPEELSDFSQSPSTSVRDDSESCPGIPQPPRRRRRVIFAIVSLDTPATLISSPSSAAAFTLAATPRQLCALLDGKSESAQNGGVELPCEAISFARIMRGYTTPFLASRFDLDLSGGASENISCRLAVEGRVIAPLADLNNDPTRFPALATAVASTLPGTGPVRISLITTATKSIGNAGGGKKATLLEGSSQGTLRLLRSALPALHRHYLFLSLRSLHWRELPVIRTKERALPIDKIMDDFTCIVKLPNQPEGGVNDAINPSVFVGMQVLIETFPVAIKSKGRETASELPASRQTKGTITGVLIPKQQMQQIVNHKLTVLFAAPVFRRMPKLEGNENDPLYFFKAARTVSLKFTRFPFATH